LISKVGLKRRHPSININMIITMLNDMEGCIPLFGFGKLNVKSMDKAAINYLSLAIHLRMEGSRIFELATQYISQCFTECAKKASVAIRDDASRKAKVWPNIVKEQGNDLGSSSGLSARDKKIHLREKKNNNPDSIMFS
jgi:hypothetical protein